MLNKIVQVILRFLIWLSGTITGVLLSPLYLVANGLVDNFPDYLDVFQNFALQHIFPGLAFAREVFLNFTGFPTILFQRVY